MNGFGKIAALVAAGVMAAGAAHAKDVVLVTGATGGTGKEVVKQLAAGGKYTVRAMVRDAAKAKDSLPAGVETVVGDVRDPATLGPALKGAKYVISAMGAGGMSKDPANGPQQVDNQGVKNLAAAAKQAGVKHLVLVSSMGTSKAETYPTEFMRPFLIAKKQGEQGLRESGVPYTIVRPGGLSDDAGGKLAVTFMQGDSGGGRIPRADVASVCIAALGDKGAANKTLEIVSGTGPWNGASFGAELAKLATDAKP